MAGLQPPGVHLHDQAFQHVAVAPQELHQPGIVWSVRPRYLWVIIAQTILGNGARAFEYCSQINPATKNNVIEQYECEPYVYPENILGDEHPQFGLFQDSWITRCEEASWTAGHEEDGCCVRDGVP